MPPDASACRTCEPYCQKGPKTPEVVPKSLKKAWRRAKESEMARRSRGRPRELGNGGVGRLSARIVGICRNVSHGTSKAHTRPQKALFRLEFSKEKLTKFSKIWLWKEGVMVKRTLKVLIWPPPPPLVSRTPLSRFRTKYRQSHLHLHLHLHCIIFDNNVVICTI